MPFAIAQVYVTLCNIVEIEPPPNWNKIMSQVNPGDYKQSAQICKASLMQFVEFIGGRISTVEQATFLTV